MMRVCTHRSLLIVFVVLACFIVAGGCQDVSEDPLPGYVPDPDIYGVDEDPSTFLEIPSAGDRPFRFPPNIVLLLLELEQPRDEAVRIAELVNGEVVGQNIGLGLYQIRLPTDTLSELDAAIETANADEVVDVAGYDLQPQTRDAVCPAPSDVQNLKDHDRCPFDETDFYLTTTIVDHLRSEMTLSMVMVGVVDTGLNVGNGEFDKASIGNAHQMGGVPSKMIDIEGHGTQVAGVITADDDDGGTNGMASRLLKDRLWVVWGQLTNQSMTTINSVQHVINTGASIINLSLGFGEFTEANTAIWKTWRRFIRQNRDVLFVAAAANEPFTLTEWNDAPAGIPEPNLITVGGTTRCDPQQTYAGSARGDLIDITATAADMAVVDKDKGRPIVHETGNSFATPQVSSAAALLKSVREELTPEQIKSYLLENSKVGPPEVGGQLLSFALPLQKLWLDTAGTSQEILDLIDADEDGEAESPGLVVVRICGGIHYSIEGIGDFVFPDFDLGMGGMITPSGVGLTSMSPDGATYLEIDMGSDFSVTEYSIVEESDGQAGTAQLGFNQNLDTMEPTICHSSDGGVLEIVGCIVEEREPVNNTPSQITVEGTFTGGLECVNEVEIITSPGIEGSFKYPFTVGGFDSPNAAAIQAIESECEFGLNF